MIYNKFGFSFRAPSTRDHKKYDAFKNDKYLASFGDVRYQQYHDRIGHYRRLDHWDEQRRDNYRSRHAKDINNYPHAGYFSAKFLW